MFVLRVPGHLPVERRHLNVGRPGVTLSGVAAVMFDFGNTLVPVGRAGLRQALELTADRAAPDLGVDREAFLAAWAEERERQFAEEVPEFREVDLDQRSIRVLARLRGMEPPGRDLRWDDHAAATHSTGSERARLVDLYSAAFVESIPAPPEVERLLARLSVRYRLGLLSNWPHATTIDRYVAAAGWAPHLSAVVVSQRAGTIKPHPDIFRVAVDALNVPPETILHVGDDWAADVVGARQAGWRVAYLRHRQSDTALPVSEPDSSVVPDLEIDRLEELLILLQI